MKYRVLFAILFSTGIFLPASCVGPVHQSSDSAAALPSVSDESSTSVLEIPCISPEGEHDTKAFGDPKNFWKKRHFTVRFIGGSPAIHQKVMANAREWSRVCGVGFSQVSSGKSDFRVSFDPSGGHWSYIGTVCRRVGQGRPTMNLAIDKHSDAGDVRRVVLHEFGHALGLMHEHQHPGSPIVWNEPAVLAYYQGPPNRWDAEKTKANVLNKYTGRISGTSGGDLRSIMHYPVPKRLTANKVSVGWNQKISPTDAKFMASKYGPPVEH